MVRVSHSLSNCSPTEGHVGSFQLNRFGSDSSVWGWGLSHTRLGEPLGGKRGDDRDGQTNRDTRNQQTSEKMLSLTSQQMNANGKISFSPSDQLECRE